MKTFLVLFALVAVSSPAVAQPDGPIPDDTTVGIGVGLQQGQLGGVVAPGIGILSGASVGSVRIRFPSGLSIEPTIAVARSGVEWAGSESSATMLSAGAAVRFGVARRGPVQLLGVGEVGVSRARSETDGMSSTMSSTQLSWGLAIDYWLRRHLALSVSATNPLVSRSTFGGGDSDFTTSSYGLQLDPTIAMMVHLFY